MQWKVKFAKTRSQHCLNLPPFVLQQLRWQVSGSQAGPCARLLMRQRRRMPFWQLELLWMRRETLMRDRPVQNKSEPLFPFVCTPTWYTCCLSSWSTSESWKRSLNSWVYIVGVEGKPFISVLTGGFNGEVRVSEEKRTSVHAVRGKYSKMGF